MRADLKEMIGRRFVKLKVLSLDIARTRKSCNTCWFCLCDCGEIISAQGGGLRNDRTTSCKGCYRTKHGMYGTPTYYSWKAMIQRCTNPNNESWNDYGGRGIGVCLRWMKFENFFADMGERPEGMTLDRYPNNDGDYEPGNARWATSEQQRSNRRDS